jgi:transcriptional regulator with XRE-family HTH domain
MTTITRLRTTSATASELVAREVRAELGRQGLSMRAFADRLGVPQLWVQRRVSVKGTTELRLDEVAEMAKALDVPVERLLAAWLPRLDSNQQPSGYPSAQASGQVIDLRTWRERVAS